MESVFPEVNEYIQEFVTRKAEEEDALLNQMSIFDMEVCNIMSKSCGYISTQ